MSMYKNDKDMDQFPGATEEPVVGLKLYGRNMCDGVVVNGWTHDFPVEFPGLQPGLKIQFVDHENVSHDQAIQRQAFLARKRTSLMQLYNGALTGAKHPIFNPVTVTVVAKKKVDCVIKNDCCLVFATILIADEEGHYCVLDLMNDAVACLYDEVVPGDCILIAGGSYFRNDGIYGGSPLMEKHQAQIGIKVASHQCRTIYKLPLDQSIEVSKVLYEGKKLWLPSELFLKGTSDLRTFKDPENPFFDVMGVVSHVGRMERMYRYSSPTALVARNNGGGFEKKYLAQYTVFRWIELVDDATATPLPVKLYINNNTWDVQKRIVPGALLTISFANRGETVFGYDHLVTSRFSSIYVNDENVKFVALVPHSFIQAGAGGRLLCPVTAHKILSRKDVHWSAGGSYSMPFKSELNFTTFVQERRESDHEPQLYKVPTLFPMERRESQHLYFKGKIIRYRSVSPGTQPEWEWTDQQMLDDYSDTKCSLIDVIVADKISDDWNLFTRKLPPLPLKPITKTTRRLEVYQDVSEAHAIYSGPLLMPVSDDPSFLKGLEALDGMPHYVVDIANEEVENKEWCRYTAVWKPSRHLSFDKMKLKLDASKGQPLTFLMEVHRLESYNCCDNSSYECILHDFTAMEPPPPESSQCQGEEWSI